MDGISRLIRTYGASTGLHPRGRCRPGGEAGSSLKLAHNFYSVGIRYCKNRMSPEANGIDENPRGADRRAASAQTRYCESGGEELRSRRRPTIPRQIGTPPGSAGTALLNDSSASRAAAIRPHAPLLHALRIGQAPLAEHEAVFKLISEISGDTTAGIADSVMRGLAGGKVGPIFDALSSVACQQSMLTPYYFALFHQNRERHLLARVTGNARPVDRQNLRLGVFSDTYDETNGVSRFLCTLGRDAVSRARSITVHTSTTRASGQTPGDSFRKNFEPLVSCPFPGVSPTRPVAAADRGGVGMGDRRQFDAIHVHTPGPMGLCGLMVGAMLRYRCSRRITRIFPPT